MSFTATPYCTLQAVKNALNLTGTSDDAWIQSELIPQAQELIDQYCGRTWQTDGTTAAPATRTYNGLGTQKIIIDDCQAVSQVLEVTYITLLGANGVWQTVNTTSTDISADCLLGPYNFAAKSTAGHYLIRKSGLPFVEGTQNYTVAGVFGNPNIPADITRACVRTAVHWYKLRDANYADSMSEQGGIRQKFVKRLPDDVVEILDFRRRRFFISRSI